MIFNRVSISLHKKTNLHFLCYLLLLVKFDRHIIFRFFIIPFLTFYFFINTEVGFKFRRLSFIGLVGLYSYS